MDDLGENPQFLGNTHKIPGDSSRDLLYAPIWRSLNLTFEGVMFLTIPKKDTKKNCQVYLHYTYQFWGGGMMNGM